MKYNGVIKSAGYAISIMLVFLPVILDKINKPLDPDTAKVVLVAGLIIAALTKIYSLSKNKERIPIGSAIIDFLTSIGLIGLVAWVLFF